MSDQVIEKTIEILTKTGIKKPPLNKKLLSKPPFRYLHDLFSEIIKTSENNSFGGLYNESEMNSENYKDKDSKVLYLSKMIEFLKLATGSNLKANPLKIVAGLDADDTNLMLQAIGKLATKKINASKAIAAVVGIQETPSSSTAPSPAPHAPSNIEREDTVNNISTPPTAQEAIPDPIIQPEITPTPPPVKQEEPAKKPSAKAKQEAHPAKDGVSLKQTPERSTRPTASKTGSAKSRLHDSMDDNQSVDEPQAAPSMAPQPNPRARPMSARPPPPKIKSAAVVNEEPNSYVSVHIASKGDDDDDFIVKAVDDAPGATNSDGADILDGQHGGLVNKILQTKKDLEGKNVTEKGGKPVAAASVGTKDITALRNSIQVLCQSTNPLGKTMDYLQEDADAMNTELALWKKENAKYEQLATEQQTITKETLGPLQDRLADIEKSIQEQLQKISILKGDILNNDAATERVLKNIASAN